jgi:hypothetical protein
MFKLKLNNIKRLKKIKVDEAIKKLENNDIENTKTYLEWINAANILIENNHIKTNSKFISFFIGICCILVAGFLLKFHLPRTNFIITVTANALMFELADNWEIKNLTIGNITIDNLKKIQIVSYDIDRNVDASFELNFLGKRNSINTFEISKYSQVFMSSDLNSLYFSIKNGNLNGELVTDSNAKTNVLDISPPINIFTNWDIVKFGSANAIERPINIEIEDTTNRLFKDFKISSIHFTKEDALHPGQFESSIISGKIKILDIDKDYLINECDNLKILKLKCQKIILKKINGIFNIEIHGNASELYCGSERFEKNLSPTLIEYIYKEQSFAFFWSVIVFVWGIIWSFKKTIFNN